MAWMPPPGGIAIYPLWTLCGPREGATSMPQVAIIGVDLAKRVFQLHGAAADGSVLFRKKLTGSAFCRFSHRSHLASWQWRPARPLTDGGARLNGSGTWCGSFPRST